MNRVPASRVRLNAMPPAPIVASTSLRRLYINVATVVGFLMALGAMSLLLRMTLAPWIAASAGTAVMVRWTVAWVTEAPSPGGQIFGRTIGIATFMGILNVGVAFCLAALAGIGPPLDFSLAPLIMVVGSPAGLGFGCAFGMWLCIPTAALTTATTRPSPSATDLSVVVLGLWALCTAALSLVPVPGAHTIYEIRMGPPSSVYRPVLLTSVAVVATLGATLAVFAARRWHARISFVRQAAQGEHEGFSTAAIAEGQDVRDLPRLGGDDDSCTHTLMKREQTGEAYRGTLLRRAIARFPGAWLERPRPSAT